VDRAVISYYDRLAPSYDSDRFGNSYGGFLDREERAILASYLPRGAVRILDLGCGTGRLTDHASHGCDGSFESLRLAAAKRPDRRFAAADIVSLPFTSGSFDAALAFHVFMHLDREAIGSAFREVTRVLRPGGVFVADIASALRRRLRPRAVQGWHGGTALSRAEFAALAERAGLAMTAARGVMLLPIHRLPAGARGGLARLDLGLAAAFPDGASYIVGRFAKHPR
jgi:SAM-dependent methyltransferase